MKIIDEFKKFALKGNAIDLAVGVVVGAAFTGIVNSLVNDIINPFLGLVTGRIDFSDKVFVIRGATESAAALTVKYGAFITALINFVIVSFAIFLVVKQINRLKDKEEAKPASEAKVSDEVRLLTEIRDSLTRR
jgi:large conductance mechanosensitive channel